MLEISLKKKRLNKKQAASIAALTVYDMCKAREQGIVIQATRLVEKRGGKNDYHVN